MFLCQLWKNGMFDYFWTDFLSLDQDNKIEVCQQIRFMRHFYTSAESVLIFLGLNGLERESLNCLATYDGKANPRDDVLNAAQMLVSLPLWTRIWIIQELSLASKGTLIDGASELDLEEFLRKATALLHHAPPSTSRHLPALRRIQSLRQSTRKAIALFRLLEDFKECQCTNPIDRVYGLLGLVVDPLGLSQRLDIRADKLPSQVFWDVVFECHFPLLGYDKLSTILLPMYPEPDPVRRLESLNDYFLDMGTSVEHRRQAGMTLSALHAVHMIMMNYVPLDSLQRHANWESLICRLFPGPLVLANPEFIKMSLFESSRRALRLGLDLACLVFDTRLPATFHNPKFSGWEPSPDLRVTEIGNEILLEPIPSDSSTASPGLDSDRCPNPNCVFSFPGGRLMMVRVETTRYSQLFLEFY
ncbi:hypothetical protein EDB81DRAFT_906322 [Dactylonectria macrodidyma]|uniref:Heterokaryon incompatibility domain-containing protein n=1 Tax=Dactylonectria macrodidyma TaxID=307937 RepID=A0A9P9E5Q5_9HYPO|nr:hypothetical protein EDB81DRAFT_906322 [Dactylonectria macrodidyma]